MTDNMRILLTLPATLLGMVPIVLYVRVSNVLLQRVFYFLLFVVPLWYCHGAIKIERVSPAKLCQLAFKLPLIPLTMALCFAVSVNVFHFTTEPMLREIRMSEYVGATELCQLGAKFLTLMFATMPILYVLDVMHKVIRDSIHEFDWSSPEDHNNAQEERIEVYSQHLLRQLLGGKNRYLRATVIFAVALVSSLPMIAFLEFSGDFYERTLAVSSCINSALRAAILTWYTCTPTASDENDDELTKSITTAMYSRRSSTIFLTLLTAVLVTWRTGLELGFESGKVFVADFLGGGSLLCFTELVEFTLLYSIPHTMIQRNQHTFVEKTSIDWMKYLVLVTITSFLMVFSSTTRFGPLIAVVICSIACMLLLTFNVKNSSLKALLLVIPLVLVEESSLFTRLLLAVVIISSTYIFRLYIGIRSVDHLEPCGRRHYGPLNDMLLAVRGPMALVMLCFFLFALIACLQETGMFGGFGKAQAYFDQDTFTDMFDEEVASAPVSRLAFCGPKQKIQYALAEGEDCYAVCDRRWFGLDIMDLTLAASMAYVNVSNGDKVTDILTDQSSRNPHTDGIADWVIRHNNVNTADWVAFLDIYSPSRNLSIIAVRGSAPRAIDWLEDLSLFGEITIFSMISGLVPGLSFWPVGFFESFFNAFQTFFAKVFGNKPMFYTPVVKYTYETQDSKPRNMVFTGHSLGGAVAKIAGTLTGYQSVGISSPGVYSSRKKFMYGKNSLRSYDLRRLVTNIVSEGDYVPAVGKLGGTTTELYCGQGPQCHSIWITICELYNKCPNGASGNQLVGSFRSIACDLTVEAEAFTEFKPTFKKTCKKVKNIVSATR